MRSVVMTKAFFQRPPSPNHRQSFLTRTLGTHERGLRVFLKTALVYHMGNLVYPAFHGSKYDESAGKYFQAVGGEDLG